MFFEVSSKTVKVSSKSVFVLANAKRLLKLAFTLGLTSVVVKVRVRVCVSVSVCVCVCVCVYT
jgi:hypothetical protein